MLMIDEIHMGYPSKGINADRRWKKKSKNLKKVHDKDWEPHYKEVTRNDPTCFRPDKDGTCAPVHKEYWIESRKYVDHSSDRSMRQFMKKNTVMHMTCICRFCHMGNNHYRACYRKMARSKVERLRRQTKVVTTDMLDF